MALQRTFGISDPDVWLGDPGSRVIHPASPFSAGVSAPEHGLRELAVGTLTFIRSFHRASRVEHHNQQHNFHSNSDIDRLVRKREAILGRVRSSESVLGSLTSTLRVGADIGAAARLLHSCRPGV